MRTALLFIIWAQLIILGITLENKIDKTNKNLQNINTSLEKLHKVDTIIKIDSVIVPMIRIETKQRADK